MPVCVGPTALWWSFLKGRKAWEYLAQLREQIWVCLWFFGIFFLGSMKRSHVQAPQSHTTLDSLVWVMIRCHPLLRICRVLGLRKHYVVGIFFFLIKCHSLLQSWVLIGCSWLWVLTLVIPKPEPAPKSPGGLCQNMDCWSCAYNFWIFISDKTLSDADAFGVGPTLRESLLYPKVTW